MLRKRPRGFQLAKSLPPKLSRFYHSIAKTASVKKVKRNMSDHDAKGKSIKDVAGHTNLAEERGQSDSSDDEVAEGIIQADFAFFDPKPSDFHGVKILMQTYLDDKEWDLSGFVDLILGQPTVGTVVKLEDDEDDSLFSVVSALNYGRYKDTRCIKDVKDYLFKTCQKKEITDDLRLLLEEEANYVGLLVSQRVTNLPPELLPPLYDALFDEISWATEDEPTDDLRNSFRFKHYLLVTRMYKHRNANQKRRPSASSDEDIIYVKPEDEIFHKLSTFSFTFPLHKQQPASHELRNYRSMGLVMAVKADKASEFRKQLQSLIHED